MVLQLGNCPMTYHSWRAEGVERSSKCDNEPQEHHKKMYPSIISLPGWCHSPYLNHVIIILINF